MPQFVNVPLKGAAQILHKRGLNMQGGYQGKRLGEKMKETEETGGAEGPECGQAPREGRTGAGWGCAWTCTQSPEGGAGCRGVGELKAAVQAPRVCQGRARLDHHAVLGHRLGASCASRTRRKHGSWALGFPPCYWRSVQHLLRTTLG